jgi:uncharacterized caspase-like protein
MLKVLSSCGYQIDNRNRLIGYVKWSEMHDEIINFFTNSKIKPTDTLLLYYSGHAVPDTDGEVYFATSEIDRELPDNRGIPFNELARMVRKSRSSRVVIILDCCYSGSATLSRGYEEEKARVGDAAIDNGSRTLRGEGRCILAASQALQEAYILEEKNHSLFTFYLLQGLQGKDREALDNQGNVTVDTLSKYVYQKIMSLPRERRPKQKPLRKVESSGDIILIEKTELKNVESSLKNEIIEERMSRTISHEQTLKSLPEIQDKTKMIKPAIQAASHAPTVHDDPLNEYRKRRLQRYIEDITRQNVDEFNTLMTEADRAFFLLEFIRDVFQDVNAKHPHDMYPRLERYIVSEHIASDRIAVVRGRVDTLLGSLIIEFETDLKGSKLQSAKSQLKRYVSILWNNEGIVNYLCVASDGLEFIMYRPRSHKRENFTEDDIDLEVVDKFDIRREDHRIIYKRLDRYIRYSPLTTPSGEEIVADFGQQSIILRDCMYLLLYAWEIVKDNAFIMYQEWTKYLSIVYGDTIDKKELFLKDTYLATLAKLMYTPIIRRIRSRYRMNKILTCQAFKENRISNFLVEDFFSWISKDSISEYGIKIVNSILEGLERYDLTKLNEDIFKELYQQLVDPVEHRRLGEFYTPEWLAEMMVKEVISEPNSRVLDPTCGSGTFLAATIRHKMSVMTETQPQEKVRT